MHKKRIKGKNYFYTSYRDENGKIKTKYLGSNENLARKQEKNFKGSQTTYWKPLLLVFFSIAGLLFLQNFIDFEKFLGLTGATMIQEGYSIYNAPSASDVGIYNTTPNFNMSIFGYGNYSDDDFDDSNGTSVYKWFVNGVLNATGNTSQLLLCHFNNNYTCEEGEKAFVTQYDTWFNTSEEQLNVTLSEENSSLVYFTIPRLAEVTEAFMNISGYLTSAYNLLKYDAILNADYSSVLTPGSTPNTDDAYRIAGVVQTVGDGVGIDSWFLITNTTNLTEGQFANILSIRYGNASGTPSNGNFSYNLKICPTSLTRLSTSQTNEPDGNCTSPYVNIVDTVNLSSNFSDSVTGGWQNFTFNDNVSIKVDGGSNYILKFEFVEGDLSTTRYWTMDLVDNPVAQTIYYVAYNYSTYDSPNGNQRLQFYSKSNYPKGVEINIGNDDDIEFADDNESFDTTNITSDFTSEIVSYLSSCSDDYCDVPVNVSSNSSGVIGLEALRVSYDHYDLDGKFLQGVTSNYTYTIRYNATNNIHNHNGTLDFWIKPYWAGSDGNEYTFFTDSDSVIQLNKSSANNLVFLVDTATVSCGISSWSARAWHLVTATWNEGENVYLYTDGASCSSAIAPTTISALGEFIYLGSDAENTSQANATLDELRITGFPRSSDEIDNYYFESRAFFQNEIFLNSTEVRLRRDDNVTFELTPVDIIGATGTADISEVIISNFVPIAPVLNQPANDTYFSSNFPFSWSNGTDYDNDDIYYALQIDDDIDFTEPVTYYSGAIAETTDPTSVTVTGVADGNYSWKVLSSDLTANSSFTDQRVVALDSTAPNLTLVSPDYRFIKASSSSYEEEIIVYFNVSESNPLENCTLNLNNTASPTINQTLTFINQTENNFTVTLAFGGYNWSINCTDIANNVNTTGKTAFSFVVYDNFYNIGRTTNLSALDDPTNVTNLTIENPEYGVINFTGVDLDLSGGLDLDSYVSISNNHIEIDSSGVPALNNYANLTLFNLSLTNIYILKDGSNCTDCTTVDDTPATFTFSVAGAGVYTASGTALPPEPIPASTGGSGGGGGTKTLTKTRNFDFDMDKFTFQMQRNANYFKKLEITNIGDLSLVFMLSHNLGEHLLISPKQFALAPGESKSVSVNFRAGEPGLYTGNILVTAGDIQKTIPIILEVRSEKVVVDAKLEVLPEYAELEQGDTLKAQVTLFNMADKEVPVVVTYLIKDLEGNVVFEETETFDMLDKKSFIKTFDTSGLKGGSYVTGMNVRYLDSFATSAARFEIKSELVKKPIIEFKWYYVGVIVSLFILITFFKLRSTDFRNMIRRKRKEWKKYEG